MPGRSFEIGDVLAEGWRLFKLRPGFWIGLHGIFWLVEIAFNILGESLSGGLFALLLSIASFLVVIRLTLGMQWIYLAAVDGDTPAWADLFAKETLFWTYLGASALFSLMLSLGFLLLIVPGIYLALRFGFYGFAMIDRDAAIGEAFRVSSRITEGHRWQLLLFGLVVIVLNLLGLLALFVGVLVTGPVSALAAATIYRRLLPASPRD